MRVGRARCRAGRGSSGRCRRSRRRPSGGSSSRPRDPGLTPGAAQAGDGEPARRRRAATARRPAPRRARDRPAASSRPTSVVELGHHLRAASPRALRREHRAVRLQPERGRCPRRRRPTWRGDRLVPRLGRTRRAPGRGSRRNPNGASGSRSSNDDADGAGGHDAVLVGERERRPTPVVGVGRRRRASCHRCRSRRAARLPPRACRRATLTSELNSSPLLRDHDLVLREAHDRRRSGSRSRRRRCGAPSPRAPVPWSNGSSGSRHSPSSPECPTDRVPAPIVDVAVGERRHPAARRAPTGRRPRSSRTGRARFGSAREVEVFPRDRRERDHEHAPHARVRRLRDGTVVVVRRRDVVRPRRRARDPEPEHDAEQQHDAIASDRRPNERNERAASDLGRDQARARATSAASRARTRRCRRRRRRARHATVASRPLGIERPDREPRHERDHAGDRDRDREQRRA